MRKTCIWAASGNKNEHSLYYLDFVLDSNFQVSNYKYFLKLTHAGNHFWLAIRHIYNIVICQLFKIQHFHFVFLKALIWDFRFHEIFDTEYWFFFFSSWDRRSRRCDQLKFSWSRMAIDILKTYMKFMSLLLFFSRMIFADTLADTQ